LEGGDSIPIVDEIAMSLLAVNDFKTLFMMLVAIVISRPISNQAQKILDHFTLFIRGSLGITADSNISDRTIWSMTYCVMALLAWFLVARLHPDFSLQQKVITTIVWPILFYVLMAGVMIVTTPLWMLPYDLIVFISFLVKKRSKK